MFEKILIANRGEIACRIIRTAKRMGIATVAVYSEADIHALHVEMADEAVLIGPAPATESYLCSDRILDAARRTGAQAIHPGYGFLSENADFAEACATAGVVFIGPTAAAIRSMGSKSSAKKIMEKAGVPLVPGYHGESQEESVLKAEAGRIGYPVMLKASAGGGGKGMRVVESANEFSDALAAAKRESAKAFGDDRMLIEKYLLTSRHIEIQVFADTRGNYVHLFERDCSVQRRHQKIIEEVPAPGVDEQRRNEMGQSAIDAARTVDYIGAGTVEFIVDSDGNFYFMEMNTRLQVEHPVTELITGQDLVEWQLRIASGEPLPVSQPQLSINGHAIEVRLYAEDPSRNFLPAAGNLELVSFPPDSRHVRTDTGIRQGDSVTVYYDPMLAKLIVWDQDRDSALRQMHTALQKTQITGISTNVDYLAKMIRHSAFVSGHYDTGLTRLPFRDEISASPTPGTDPGSPWSLMTGWRLNLDCYDFADHEIFDHDSFTGNQSAGGSLTAPMPCKVVSVLVQESDSVQAGAAVLILEAMKMEHTVTSPVAGTVTAIHFSPGDLVEEGVELLTIEAG